MEQGLAQTYGSGEGQNVTHYYAGIIDKPKRKKKMACKKGKSKKGK